MRTDSEAMKRKDPRPLKDIAADIFCFPMLLPEQQVFDSSMRLPPSEKTADHFGNYLQMLIADAPQVAAQGGPTLQERVTAGPLPRVPVPSRETPASQLAYSTVALERLHAALVSIMTQDRAGAAEKGLIETISYPLVELMAEADTAQVAKYRRDYADLKDALSEHIVGQTGKDPEQVREAQAGQHAEVVANLERNARNLRQHIQPLFDELAAALNVTRARPIAKS